jgi:hypothetical protein
MLPLLGVRCILTHVDLNSKGDSSALPYPISSSIYPCIYPHQDNPTLSSIFVFARRQDSFIHSLPLTMNAFIQLARDRHVCDMHVPQKL